MPTVVFTPGFDSSMRYAIYGTYAEFGPKGMGPSRLSPHPIFPGYDVYRLFKENEIPIYAVSPDVNTVDGDPAYASFDLLPSVDALIMATPGSDALQPLQQAHAARLDKVLFLRSTMNQAAQKFCESSGITYAAHCLLRHRKITGSNRFFAFCFWHGLFTLSRKLDKHVARI